ncbi:dhkK [Symbiodinium microadriaticum]|nr:dhkK [Symbiodinium microadriaticum]
MTLTDGCETSQGTFQMCSNDAMPLDQIIVYVVVVSMIPVVVKSRHLWATIVSIAIEAALLMIINFRLNYPNWRYLYAVTVVVLMQSIIVIEYEHFSRRMYLQACGSVSVISHHRAKLEAENETRLMDRQGVEMRHLFGNVAHDLKTPMQALYFELDTVSRYIDTRTASLAGLPAASEPTCERNLKHSVDVMRGALDYMLMFVNRALDYSKVGSGLSLMPHLETVSVSDSLGWVVKCVKSMDSPQCRAEYVIEGPIAVGGGKDIAVFTDKQWLLENMLCLVANARKYSTSGLVSIRCSVVPERPTGLEAAGGAIASGCRHLLVEVLDDGLGVLPSEREALFQPAKQQATRRAGGTGLGLFALAKRVESLGGKYGLSNRLDGLNGSRFWFSIPCVQEGEHIRSSPFCPLPSTSSLLQRLSDTQTDASLALDDVGARKTLEDSGGDRELDQPTPDILVVDDSTLIQKTSTRAFHNAGIAVDVAVNGLDCLKKVALAASGQYQLILMDIQMPCMDGLECTRQLRQMERERNSALSQRDGCSFRHHAVIVGLSANSDNETRSEAMEAGMDGFMSKPMTLAALRICLKSIGSFVLSESSV